MISEDQVERVVDIKLKGGKLTKKKVELEYFEYMQLWIRFKKGKYASGELSADKFGRKLFVSFDQATKEIIDRRIQTKTITKILQSRIKEFACDSMVELSEDLYRSSHPTA